MRSTLSRINNSLGTRALAQGGGSGFKLFLIQIRQSRDDLNPGLAVGMSVL